MTTLLGALVPGTAAPAAAPHDATPPLPLRRGVNFAGPEFSSSTLPGTPGVDYWYPQPASLAYLAGRGHTDMRLPVLWERIQPTRSAALDSGEAARLLAAVTAANNAGLRVAVDLHNYARHNGQVLGSSGGPTAADLADVWIRIGTLLAGRNIDLGLMNEPHDLPTVDATFVAAQSVSTWDAGGVAGWSGENCSLANATNQHQAGAGSLALTRSDLTAADPSQVYRANLPDDGLSLSNGGTLSAWVLVPAGTGGTWSARLEMQGSAYNWTNGTSTTLTPGTWARIQYTPASDVWVGHRAIGLQVLVDAPGSTPITVFVDTVQQGALVGEITESKMWEQISSTAVAAIRAAGETRPILTPSGEWAHLQRWIDRHPAPWMPGVLYEAHHYWDGDASGVYWRTYAQEVAYAESQGWTAGPNGDAVTERVLAELAAWTTWLANHGVQGVIGEAGWPSGADATAWSTLAEKWYAACDAAGVSVYYWAAGEHWGSYPLSLYGVDGSNVLATPLAQAAVVEAHGAGVASPVLMTVFEDAFTGPLDDATWLIRTGTAVPGGPAHFGTGEIQTYTTGAVAVTGGSLRLTATRDGAGAWTSGRVESRRTDLRPLPGELMRIEASITLPAGTDQLGIWPAMWLIGEGFASSPGSSPMSGELDILESVNGSGVIYGTGHGGLAGASWNVQGSVTDASANGAPRIYALEWDRTGPVETIRWLYGGVVFHAIEATSFDAAQWVRATAHGFQLILNLAIGGAFPDWGAGQTTPIPATASPVEMAIDWVRISSTSGTLAPDALPGGFTGQLTGTTPSPFWTPTGVVAVSGGQMSVLATSSYVGRAFTTSRYDMRGMQAVARAVSIPAADGQESWLEVADDYDNKIEIGFSGWGGGQLISRSFVGGVVDAWATPWDATAMAWWRIRCYADGSALWQTSPDGATWTTRRTLAAGGLTLVRSHIAVSAGHWSGDDATAIVSDLSVTAVAAGVALTAAAVLTGSATVTRPANGGLASPSSLAGAATRDVATTGALTATATLTGTGVMAQQASGAMTHTAALAGAADRVANATGALVTAVALAGSAAPSSTGTGSVAGAAVLTGAATVTRPVAGDVAPSIALGGAAAAAARPGAGALPPAVALTGGAERTVAATGSLSAAMALSGSVDGGQAATGALTSSAALAGGASRDAAATGALVAFAVLPGGGAFRVIEVSGSTTSAAVLTGSAIVPGVVDITGALTAAAALAGSTLAIRPAPGAALTVTAVLTGAGDVTHPVIVDSRGLVRAVDRSRQYVPTVSTGKPWRWWTG